jgi:hypothetical protein
MEILTEDRIKIRDYILNNLEYFIQESVYYRSFSEDMDKNKKQILVNINSDTGKLSTL